MQFAHPLPWWLALLIAAAILLSTFLAYRRPLARLERRQHALLVGLRIGALAALVLFLFRPVLLLPPADSRGAIVPVLVDVSRSMRLTDAGPALSPSKGSESRLARAAALVKTQLVPELSTQFDVVIQQMGDQVAPASLDGLHADARRSDLRTSLDAVRERYRGQQVAAIVVVSDGGDTSPAASDPAVAGPPVYTIGVGAADGLKDREIIGAAIGDPKIDQSSVDLRVSAVSSGFGRTPFQLRLLANGVVVDTRRVVPQADGSPIDERFTVSPDPLTPTVYKAEIPAAEGEEVSENNARSVLVSPAGRKRRLLIIEGAPGFEHSFMKRALMIDPGLEVDSVTRKGKNADGQDTFFVQGGSGRTAALTGGFPARREDLYAYDAMFIANVEGDFFTRAQLAMAADFVSERGGGLLVMGGRSFQQQGLIGTPLEVALPVELNDRRGVLRTSLGGTSVAPNTVVVTPEGENHPIMRLGDSADQTRRLWAALPALAGNAPLGAPRPGATVLAVAAAAGGVSPMIAVQRFGQGRSMVFAGEASWRWKMMVASTDRTYEMFWRHAARWLAGPAPDPVAITVPEAPEPGDAASIGVDVRNAAFAPMRDATVDATLTLPGGGTETLKLRKTDPAGSRFTAPFEPAETGLYHVRADAHQGTTLLGSSEQWVYVGGSDREFADPRLNEGFLQRMARASGGGYVRADEASQVVARIQSGASQSVALERRDVWHEPWAFALIVAMLASEWTLRRRWGLR